MIIRGGILAALLLASACGATDDGDRGRAASDAVEVNSTDFALLPCQNVSADRACTLMIAGGKRVLLGAPEGVSAGLAAADLKNLDAVLLFSLRGADIEGLDAVRNASWRAGRGQPLPVIGPIGIDEIVSSVNTAYEASDALAYVEGRAGSSYDVAVLEARDADGQVFDTGDLRIMASEDMDGWISYDVLYDGMRARVSPCSARPGEEAEAIDDVFTVSCREGSAAWPITSPVFIRQTKG